MAVLIKIERTCSLEKLPDIALLDCGNDQFNFKMNINSVKEFLLCYRYGHINIHLSDLWTNEQELSIVLNMDTLQPGRSTFMLDK